MKITAIAFFAAALMFVSQIPACAAGDAKRGAALFASNCQFCHFGGGNSLNPSKPLKGEAFARKFDDARVFATIRNGIPGSAMSPFPPDRLSDEQVRDIIAYIRTLTPTASAASAGVGPGLVKNGRAPQANGYPKNAVKAPPGKQQNCKVMPPKSKSSSKR
jgi:cytochrome c6